MKLSLPAKSAFLTLALALMFCITVPVSAAEKGAGLIVSPPIDEKTVQAGQTIAGTIKITSGNPNISLRLLIKWKSGPLP